ncbi:hypothetical protein B9G98_00429 [Wickerhamiella sorbophila]|uniref:WLM domain-containing protein n=1 Tax=Wickerhamiella sorbophila TaxID=45607 RepID=A0A2T0FCZ4_9ASCO|nr:hypothetical protein B9G98_00429 [Wickerhamiella sorbophila]PRT52809.1 hypothetical protein B9G98_00429 [Wickerhamiella sorbophila]
MQVTFRKVSLEVDDNLSIKELQGLIEKQFHVPASGQSFLANGKRIVLNPEAKISDPVGGKTPTKIMVLGSSQQKSDEIASSANAYIRQEARREQAVASLAARKRAPAVTTAPTEYTFHEIKALPYGDSQGALDYLQRIKDDLGVRVLMEKYKLKVNVLSELDPALNTGSKERRLGLNRNRGEMIELRIRTDDYMGFCNFNEVKKVLCHELAHNTQDDHDEAFWKVCRLYEREINQGWGTGHRLDS